MSESKEQVPSLNDIIDQVESYDLEQMPSLAYFKEVELSFVDIREALELIESYKDKSTPRDPERMAEDALFLAAIHTTLSEVVGYLQGTSSRGESTKQYIRSTHVMKIKSIRDDLNKDRVKPIKLTEQEIDHASRVLSREAEEAARDAEVISRMMTNLWYSIGDFVKILSSAIYRSSKEWNSNA